MEEAYSNPVTESGSCAPVSSQQTDLGKHDVRPDTGSSREDAAVSKEVVVVAEVSIPSESEPWQKDRSEGSKSNQGTISEATMEPEGEGMREEEQERGEGETGGGGGGGGETSASVPPIEVVATEDNCTSPSSDQAKEPTSPLEVTNDDTTPLLEKVNNTNAAHSEEVATANEVSGNSVQKTGEESRTIPAGEGTNNLRDSLD